VIEGFGIAPEVNFLDAQDYRASSTRVETNGIYDAGAGTLRLTDGGAPFSATVMGASADLLTVLGLSPALGRALTPEEYVYGGPSSVMLGHRFWRSHFGGDPAVVGRSLQLGTERRTIVGVLPPEADRFPAGGAKAAVYCASKGAVVMLTKAMAIDHGPQKIRVNCLCPGDTDTGMLRDEAQQLGEPSNRFLADSAKRPLGRVGNPDEIAQAALYLASDASSFVTGTALVVDGGGLAGSV
jgi:NAD(P)-dependent dehydrogenase (short-subunit alcohol dehydrogenase family)